MRYGDFNRWPPPPEPFTVEGDLQFILRAFSMPEGMRPEDAERAFLDHEPRVLSLTGKSCIIINWSANVGDDQTTYTIKAVPMQASVAERKKPTTDPWIKVGTTTIDGSRAHVAAAFGCRPHDLGPVLAQAQGFACLVGGRMLRVSSYDLDDEMSIVRCDIVRRQSEIETEGAAKQDEFNRAIADMEERDYPHGLPHPRCPECGPHGNRGEVLLASSWAKCTTCAGGRPGDLWGEVRTERPALGALAIGDLVFDHDVEVARGIPITITVS